MNFFFFLVFFAYVAIYISRLGKLSDFFTSAVVDLVTLPV